MHFFKIIAQLQFCIEPYFLIICTNVVLHLVISSQEMCLMFESQLSSHTHAVSMSGNSTPITFVITVMTLRKF